LDSPAQGKIRKRARKKRSPKLRKREKFTEKFQKNSHIFQGRFYLDRQGVLPYNALMSLVFLRGDGNEAYISAKEPQA
jgi:hypothetical protein